MFADYSYYTGTYKGTKITSANEYTYLAQKADFYIKRYDTVTSDNTKMCECALSEYLLTTNGNVASESIQGAYSVSYNSGSDHNQEIGNILELYLGDKYTPVVAFKI